MEIPQRFLPQVMADLARAGIVDGVTGTRGGYCLRRDPAAVSLLDVIEIVEGPALREPRVVHQGPCNGEPACALHPVWDRAQAAFADVLAGTSIAELAACHGAAFEGNGRKRPERTDR